MGDYDGNCISAKATSSQCQDSSGSPAKEKGDMAAPTVSPTPKHKCGRPEYDMSGERLMFIFNHKEYKDSPYYLEQPSTRDGTEHDVRRLNKIFGKLKFNVAEPYNNYTHDQIENTVKQICNMDHSNTSCVAIAILTHGHENEILCAADKPFYLSDVVTRVLQVKQLAGKPKLFFIQACRGGKGNKGFMIETDGHDFRGRIPTHSDLLILKANFEGFVSFRSPKNGSWMIQSLCDILEMYHEEKDVLHMMTMVNNHVAAKTSYMFQKEYDRKKQIPVIRFTLRKLLRF